MNSTKPMPKGHKIEKFDFIATNPAPRQSAVQSKQDWEDEMAFVRQSAYFPNNLNYGCQIQKIQSEIVVEDEDPNTTTVDRAGARTHRPSDADQCVVRVRGEISGPPAKIAEWKAALSRVTGGEDSRLLPAREQLRNAKRDAADAG